MKSSLHFCQAEEINWSLKSLKSTSPPGGPDIVKMQRSPSDSIGQQHDTPSPTARGEVGAKSWVGEHSWKLSPGSSPINLAAHETVETISWWSSPTFSHDISTQLLTNSVRYGACSMIHLHPKLVHVVFLQKQVERWVHQCPSKNIRSCRRNGKYYYPSIAPLHRCCYDMWVRKQQGKYNSFKWCRLELVCARHLIISAFFVPDPRITSINERGFAVAASWGSRPQLTDPRTATAAHRWWW